MLNYLVSEDIWRFFFGLHRMYKVSALPYMHVCGYKTDISLLYAYIYVHRSGEPSKAESLPTSVPCPFPENRVLSSWGSTCCILCLYQDTRALLITEHITSPIRCLGSISLWHILKNSRQLTSEKEDYGPESRVNPGKEHLRLIPSLLGTAGLRPFMVTACPFCACKGRPFLTVHWPNAKQVQEIPQSSVQVTEDCSMRIKEDNPWLFIRDLILRLKSNLWTSRVKQRIFSSSANRQPNF